MKSSRSSTLSVDPTLARALVFDGSDLQDNQSGFFSHTQRKRLQRLRFIHSSVAAGLAWSLFNLFVTLMFAAGLVDAIGTGALNLLTLVIMGGMTLFGLAMIGSGLKVAWDHFQQVNLDLENGRVNELQGVVARWVKRSRSTETLYIGIGEQSFIVPASVYHAFVWGTEYAIYYAPESHILLSAAPLPQK